MASVSKAQLVIISFFVCNCLHSVRSNDQREPLKFSVGSVGLRSSTQKEAPNPSVGSLSLLSYNQQNSSSPSVGFLGPRTAKHQTLRESIKRYTVMFNYSKPSDAERSIGYLGDIKQHEMPKHFLEFFNQHKLTPLFSDNLVQYANQHKLSQFSTNSLDFSNHHSALRLSSDSLTSTNNHEPSNFSPGRKVVCPKHCRCTYCQDRTTCTVDCSNMGLREIPELPETSTKIYLQNNHIKDVPCTKLKYLKNLKELYLSQNGNIKLFNCSFSNVTSLERLSLVTCNLTSLPVGIFHSLRYLVALDVSENIVSNLDTQPFINMQGLLSLNLSQNKLRRIRNDTFQGLDALVFLSLQKNLLYYLSDTFELDAFQGLTSLKSLHLKGNRPNFSENLTYPE